jgi:hypothetical protein
MGLMAHVLAECITKKNSATGSVIDDWLKRYRTSSASGGCEIVNLVLRVAGSPKDFFTIEQYDDTDSDVSLDGFAKRFKTYFLDPRKKATSDNAAVYEEFWHKLVQKSQNKFVSKSQCSILHDFSDKVIAWLTKLSVYVSGTHGDMQRDRERVSGRGMYSSSFGTSVSQRPVRHAATIGALHFGQALVNLIAKDTEQLSKHQKASDRYRKNKDSAKEKVEKENIATLQTRMADTNELLDALFVYVSNQPANLQR